MDLMRVCIYGPVKRSRFGGRDHDHIYTGHKSNQIIMPRAPARPLRLVACNGSRQGSAGRPAGPRPACRAVARWWPPPPPPHRPPVDGAVLRRMGARAAGPAPVPHRRYGGPSRQRGSGRRSAPERSPQLVTSVTCGACRPWISAPLAGHQFMLPLCVQLPRSTELLCDRIIHGWMGYVRVVDI